MAKHNSKISVFSSRAAVVGAQYGKWKLKKEPDKEDTIQINSYFDEDAHTCEQDGIKEEKRNEEIWTGEGELTIIDFAKFVEFIQSVISTPPIIENK